VEDADTLPSRFGRYALRYRPYNFGCRGWGPQHALVLLERPDLLDILSETEGLAFYVFIDDHIPRVIGSSRIVSHWGEDFPCFRLEGEELIRDGSFRTGRPGTTWFLQRLAQLNTVRYLGLEYPPIREPHVELTARIIAEASRRFEEAKPESRFIVILYSGAAKRMGPRLIPYLERFGVAYLDYTEIATDLPRELRKTLVLADGHPRPEQHDMVAKALARDVETLLPDAE
jgi:hypothetical protein